MNYSNVLSKLESNDITPELAYKELYNKKNRIKPGKRATFIKLRIHVPNEGKGLNTFLRILFALPIPLVFARWGLKIANKHAKLDENNNMDIEEILYLLKYSKGTKVQVEAKDAIVDIKII